MKTINMNLRIRILICSRASQNLLILVKGKISRRVRASEAEKTKKVQTAIS